MAGFFWVTPFWMGLEPFSPVSLATMGVVAAATLATCARRASVKGFAAALLVVAAGAPAVVSVACVAMSARMWFYACSLRGWTPLPRKKPVPDPPDVRRLKECVERMDPPMEVRIIPFTLREILLTYVEGNAVTSTLCASVTKYVKNTDEKESALSVELVETTVGMKWIALRANSVLREYAQNDRFLQHCIFYRILVLCAQHGVRTDEAGEVQTDRNNLERALRVYIASFANARDQLREWGNAV